MDKELYVGINVYGHSADDIAEKVREAVKILNEHEEKCERPVPRYAVEERK